MPPDTESERIPRVLGNVAPMNAASLIAWIVTVLAGLVLLIIWLMEYDGDFQSAAATRLPVPLMPKVRERPAVIVFLWDVRTLDGGSARGVTDDETQARLAASKCMLANGVMGRIERAVTLTAGAWLTDGYLRLGSGWSLGLRSGRVISVPFREAAKELDKAS